MRGDGSGFAAGVREALDAAGAPLPFRDAEQLELIRDSRGVATTSGAEVGMAPRGRGRPRGALNKASAKIRDWLLSGYAHPLEVLASTYSRPVDALAAELGCSKLEAARLQIQAASEVAPYVEGKQPVTVDVTHRSDAVLIMTGPGQSMQAIAHAIEEGGMEAIEGIDWSVAQVIENAPVSGGE